MTYFQKLKDPRWQKVRLKVFERDGWKCVVCLSGERTLEVHHTRYGRNPWDVPQKHLQTLCRKCHREKHSHKESKPDGDVVSKEDGNAIFAAMRRALE